MTPEAQRIAIAEASKWKAPRRFWSKGKHCYLDVSPPDYLNDLNAMHEAEKILTNDEWDDKFYYWLGHIVSGGLTEQLWEYRKAVVHATAAQRAEALLRTLGKWVD